jgi:hypothetical protein
MIILVCGSRTWGTTHCQKCFERTCTCFEENQAAKDAIEREFILHGFDPARDEIVHGAARGADTLTKEVAEERGWTHDRIRAFPAQWDRYGKSAGTYRNQDMLNYLVGQRTYAGEKVMALAFAKDIEKSVGTRHMVRILRTADVPVEVFNA